MSPESLSLPHFIVIGAQKCGTTTLHEDLRQHPDVFLSEKESNGLLAPVETSESVRRYASLFRRSPSGSTVGEVATTYSMLPQHPHVPDRAAAVRPDMRIIYIVRDPLDRVISHHHHDFGLGLVGPDIDRAVHEHPALLDHSRYGTQLRPWAKRFGADRVLVVRFEDYVRERQTGFDAVVRFLGLDPCTLHDQAIHNSSADKVVPTGRWGQVSTSRLYRHVVRPLVGERLRRHMGRALLPAAPERPASPSMESLQFMRAQLEPEVVGLADLVGVRPMWDLNASVSRLATGVQRT